MPTTYPVISKIKLDAATQANELDPRYEKNVTALTAIMPTPIEPFEIRVRLGATWIPMRYMSQFIEHIVTGENDTVSAEKQFSVVRSDASWVVRVDKRVIEGNEGRTKEMFGTRRLSADAIIEKLLNSRKIVVKDTKLDSEVVNSEATLEANLKADQISQAFKDWVWATPARMAELSKIYNEQFNVFVEQQYDGSHFRSPHDVAPADGQPV